MSSRYALTAALITALAIPGTSQRASAAQTSTAQTASAQSDTSSRGTNRKGKHGKKHRGKRGTRGTHTGTSYGAIDRTSDTTTVPPSPTPARGTEYNTSAAVAGNANVPASSNMNATVRATDSLGRTTPQQAARVDIKVNQSLASTAKVSADSAFAIARRHADNGEISSAELENCGGRLVYEVHVLNKSKRASTVTIDAMNGEVVEATQHGGLKSTLMHHKENKKLLDAKRDSAAKKP
jgi:uncharacterized membrane protein YkoI